MRTVNVYYRRSEKGVVSEPFTLIQMNQLRREHGYCEEDIKDSPIGKVLDVREDDALWLVNRWNAVWGWDLNFRKKCWYWI